MTILLLILITILLITHNQIVLSGASYGLMLWYQNVVPLLLPFMLISGTIEKQIIKGKNNTALAIPSIIFLGLFCGYPIGAKASATFTKAGIIKPSTGNLLLPLCNNVSPMFFLGFIINKTLKNSIHPFDAYAVIFIPIIVVLIIDFIITKCFDIISNHCKLNKHEKLSLNYKQHLNQPNITQEFSKTNITEQCITQITMVGLYIMLCSIISEFILSINISMPNIKILAIGITEITRGATYICQTNLPSMQDKAALILACTSFGGLSSILQTAKVIQDSGLSLAHYIITKTICAVCTYGLCIILFI